MSMTRLTRIVCDNPDCKAQVEFYATDYYHNYQGMVDTPEGWYCLTYHEPKTVDAETAVKDPREPRYFCSVICVRNFTGEIKEPQTRE
jgi:uncharacterized protein involved in tellurium resistance